MADYGQECPGSVSNSSSSFLGRQRHFYTDVQLELLDAEFAAEAFPSRENRRRIAFQLGVAEKSVLWWFQNRRRRVRQRCKAGESNGLISGRSRRQRRSSPYAVDQQRPVPDLIRGNNWNSPAPSWPPAAQSSGTYSDQYYSKSSSPTELALTVPVLPLLSDVVSDNYVGNQTDAGHQPYSVATDPITPGDLPEFQPHPTYSYWNNWQYGNPPFYPSSTWYPAQESCNYYYPDTVQYCNQNYY